MLSTPSVQPITAQFYQDGWTQNNIRIERLIHGEAVNGFLTDADLCSAEELENLPIYKDFLRPRGFAAGAATLINGAQDDGIVLTFEGFEDHAAARASVAFLDELRPHLARATLLSSRVQDNRLSDAAALISAVHIPILFLDFQGRILAANPSCFDGDAPIIIDAPKRMRLSDPIADEQWEALLARAMAQPTAQSIAIRNAEKQGAAILHIIQSERTARDLFSRIAYIGILSKPENYQLPSADMVSALFDLTATESRVARRIANAQTIQAIAIELGISTGTVRTHLKHIFAKTFTHRQNELASLLFPLGGPGPKI